MSEALLRERIEELTAALQEQDALLKKLTAMPFTLGTVLDVLKDSIVIDVGQRLEVNKPTKKGLTLKPGDVAQISPLSNQIVGKSTFISPGPTAEVQRVVSSTHLEIMINGQTFFCLSGETGAEAGDRVALDRTMTVAVLKIKQGEEKFVHKDPTLVKWSSIGGQRKAKQALIEAIELPTKFRTLFQRYKRPPIKGVVLHGPPGNGKTLLAKAAATSMAETFGKEAVHSGFLAVNGPELMSKWYGESERMVRDIFQQCREHYLAKKVPAVLFIDEADAVLAKRGNNNHSGLTDTIVNQFLGEVDGMDDAHCFVILATNRVELLDPAVIREGRMDRVILVAGPDRADANEILRIHLTDIPMAVSMDEMVTKTLDQLYSSDYALYAAEYTDGGKDTFGMGAIASGAMLAGVVEKATITAIHRVIKNGVRSDRGVCLDDMKQAVHATYETHYERDHKEDIQQLIAQYGRQVRGVRKAPRFVPAPAQPVKQAEAQTSA